MKIIILVTIFTGALAVAVPGEIRGLRAAHLTYGKLDWKDLIEPSIKLARDGIKIGRHMSLEIERSNKTQELIKKDPGLR